jgi:hypothetical protein
MEALSETLHGWQNFYFMAGGAAATLLGLMFVALSLGMHLITEATKRQIEAFASPSVFYFASVLFLAGVMLVPAYVPLVLTLVLVVGGVLGLGRTIPSVRLLIQAARKHQDFTAADWLSQIILPVLSYSLILMAGIGFVVNQSTPALIALWISTILLLLCGITNTWSIVIWIIEQPNN